MDEFQTLIVETACRIADNTSRSNLNEYKPIDILGRKMYFYGVTLRILLQDNEWVECEPTETDIEELESNLIQDARMIMKVVPEEKWDDADPDPSDAEDIDITYAPSLIDDIEAYAEAKVLV